VVSIQEGAVVVLTTSHTTTTGVRTVLTNATVTGGNITTLLAVCLITSGLKDKGKDVALRKKLM